jgi:hypothetical protein
MVLEVRDGLARKTSFSAIHVGSGELLLKDVTFEEPWWVGLDGAQGDVALFSVFTETSNPDRKALIAYHIGQQKILWWKNDFSLSVIGSNCVSGVSSQLGHRELTLDLLLGTETDFVAQSNELSDIRRPSQYVEGHAYFRRCKLFCRRISI